MTHKLLVFATALLAVASIDSAQARNTGRPITVRATEGLQFDPPRAQMETGQTVTFRFLNRDPNDQPHNLIIIKPDSLEAIQQASMQIDAESIARGYVPEHEAVLAHTKLLDADQSEEFKFTSPEEPGIYHYVCTYPGHAMIMYGALYVGVKPGSLENDPNISQFAREKVKRLAEAKQQITRPAVRRFFMENAGPATIAVALENDMNYCWDAGNCRLRYAWAGSFLKLGDNSRSNGSRQARMGGKEFWNGGGDELTFSIDVGDEDARPDFKGYKLIEGRPVFSYGMGGLEVEESITGSSGGLVIDMKISGAEAPVKVYAKGNITSDTGKREGDFITFSPAEAAKIQLTIPSK